MNEDIEKRILVRCDRSGNDVELGFISERCDKVNCFEYREGNCNLGSYCKYPGFQVEEISDEEFIQDLEY